MTPAATRQRSFRWSTSTLAALERRARERNEPGSKLAERLVDEGLRMDRHPGIVFRDGPAGRCAALAAGPDVWELIRFLRDIEATGDQAVAAAVDLLGLSTLQVESALAYYADHRAEIDARIALDEEAASRIAESLRHREDTLGPPG